MSELFAFDRDQYQEMLRDSLYPQRFAEVAKLTESQRNELAIDWATPNPESTFHKICLEGIRNLYIVTDPLYPNPRLSFNPDQSTVFGFWTDEQNITHTHSQKAVTETIKKAWETKQMVRTLDVGTGSGISAIIMQNFLQELGIENYENIGVDLNQRAIDFARLNTQLNGLEQINWKTEIYNSNSAPTKDCDVIQLENPYNPRPEFLAKHSPVFSDGWSEDGTLNFKTQISIAYQHLAQDGIIVINMMSPNSVINPERSVAIETIQNLDPTMSIDCLEIYPPINSGDFLNATFDKVKNDLQNINPNLVRRMNEFTNRLNQLQNQFHYNVIIVKNDGKGELNIHQSDLPNNWDTRTAGHKDLNIIAWRKMVQSQI
jgi:Ribosomal protein L11 methyltransferase (PrmA)